MVTFSPVGLWISGCTSSWAPFPLIPILLSFVKYVHSFLKLIFLRKSEKKCVHSPQDFVLYTHAAARGRSSEKGDSK